MLRGFTPMACACLQKDSDLNLAETGATQCVAEGYVENATRNDLADCGAKIWGEEAQ